MGPNKPEILFEVSYEGGHKVGGIYTVLLSKAAQMKKIYGNNYYVIGIFNPESARINFDSTTPPPEFAKVIQELDKVGIKCYYGKWLRASNVNLILIDSTKFAEKIVPTANNSVDKNINLLKHWLWKKYGIDSMMMGGDFNECVAWSISVGKLIERLLGTSMFKGKKIVAHFHEWLAGAGLLYLRSKNLPIGLVFTTHATFLGRCIASSGRDLSKIVSEGLKRKETIGMNEAYNFHVEGKHILEVQCTHNADIFTTVSEVTAAESAYILGRKVDVVLPNALDFSKFASVDKLSAMHQEGRWKIKRFLKAYFGPYYKINLEGARIFFICGRYEFSNKGIDIFIRALGKLNKRLKKENFTKEIFAFIWVPSSTSGPKDEVLRNMMRFHSIENYIRNSLQTIRRNMLDMVCDGTFSKEDLVKVFGSRFISDCKDLSEKFLNKSGKYPPLCAFRLTYDEATDVILNELHHVGLNNAPENKVKVVFYPTYLSATDQLLGLDYYSALNGADAGFFPSKYEPWGYTPVETSALFSLSVTTDLAGFGKFLLDNVGQTENSGIRVILRQDRSDEDAINQLTEILHEFSIVPLDKFMKLKMNARLTAEKTDWNKLIKYYIKAHNMALEKAQQRCSTQ
jgi:glycogen(starch) synthase